MEFLHIQWLGVLVAFVVNFVVGFVYFSPKVAFTAWWNAMGKEGEPGDQNMNMGAVFGLTALSGLIASFAMAALFSLVAHATGDIPLGNALGLGLLVGGGMVAMHALTHRLFAGHGLKVWALETGGDVLSYLAIAATLSFWY